MKSQTLILCVVSIMMTCSMLQSQSKHDYIWIFSSDIDQTLPNSEGSIIDFNGGKVTTYYQETSNMIGSDNISYSSEDGELVAYSNGCDVFNSDFVIMENGEDVNPGEVHDVQCVIDNYPSLQNSLMLPDPGGDGIYFYHKSRENRLYGTDLVGSFYDVMYSYIDINTNSVRVKNKLIHDRVPHTSSFTEAIQHANGEDWWILDFSQWDSLEVTPDDTLMYVFKIDKDSIYFHHEQELKSSPV